jgi:hypothetical protein
LAKSFIEANGLSIAEGANVAAFARAQVSGGLAIFGNGATAAAGIEAKVNSSSLTSQEKKAALALLNSEAYRSQVAKTNTLSRTSAFDQSNDATSQAARDVRASLNDSQTYANAAAANHTKASEFSTAANYQRSNSGSMDANYNNQRMDWLTGENGFAGQKNPATNKNYTVSEIEELDRKGKSGALNQRFVDEVLSGRIDDGGIPKPTNNTAAVHAENLGSIKTPAQILTAAAVNTQAVRNEQAAAGLNPDSTPKNNVSPSVNRGFRNAEGAINLGASGIDKSGNQLRSNVERAVDPTTNSNLFTAAANAASMITPNGTSMLMRDAGLIPDNASVALQTANQYKGTTADALIETGAFVAGFALGGVGGRVATKLEGEAFASVAARVGQASGDVVEATAVRVATKVEARTAEAVARGDAVAATPEAVAAANAATRATTDRAVAKAAVEAEKTVEVAGQLGGTIVGGASGGHLGEMATGNNGEHNKPVVQPAIEDVRNTNAAVLDIVSDVASLPKSSQPVPVQK